MEPHHEVQLSMALDQLYLEGATFVRWDHLYLWLNADRLGKRAYRELLWRWKKLCTETYEHDSAPELSVLHWPDKPTLTLLRGRFDDEKLELFEKWTK